MTRQKSKVNDNSFHSHAHFLRFQKKPRGSKELLLGKTGPIFIISKEMSLKLFQKNCQAKVSGKYICTFPYAFLHVLNWPKEKYFVTDWNKDLRMTTQGHRHIQYLLNKERLEFKTIPFLIICITGRCVSCNTNIWGISVLITLSENPKRRQKNCHFMKCGFS